MRKSAYMDIAEVKELLIRGCEGILRPVARFLLRGGVTYREFEDVAKRAFVTEALIEFGTRGRATNTSRIAVMTGLTRREVAQIRDRVLRDDDAPVPGYVSPASRLLSLWHLDPRFHDAAGQPADLEPDEPRRGDPGSKALTFADLARECSGDVPPGAMFRQLLAANAVMELPNGRVRVVSRNYMPSAVEESSVRYWGSALADHATALSHNYLRRGRSRARFERRALNRHIERRHADAFSEFVESEGQAFLERIDAWLSEREALPGAATDVIRLGVGVYQIDDTMPRRGLRIQSGSEQE